MRSVMYKGKAYFSIKDFCDDYPQVNSNRFTKYISSLDIYFGKSIDIKGNVIDRFMARLQRPKKNK